MKRSCSLDIRFKGILKMPILHGRAQLDRLDPESLMEFREGSVKPF